jgi:SHS2 domain-containing protein
MKKNYEFLEHTADVQIRAWGENLKKAYEQAALALQATISPNTEKIDSVSKKELKITAEDREALLFDFLSEFLYIFDVEKLIFGNIKVERIEKTNDELTLEAILYGEKFNPDKHEIGTEVKAITYSYMKIEEKEDKTEVEVVFDI